MSGPTPGEQTGLRALWSLRGLLGVLLPILLTTAIHYGAPHHAHWVHDVARRLFYIPIVLGAALGGLQGGVLVAVLVWLLYLPHAFLMPMADPSSGSEKGLELVFYVVLGGLFGGVVDRLRAKDAQLARAARLEALGQLTAGLAHEIKNPLHAMRGTAEIVLDAVPPDREEHAMGQALIQEIDRLDGVLKRFLDYARPTETALSAVSLGEVAERVETLVRAQASRQGTRVEVQPAEVQALADAEQLTQVVLGICLNGLQALGQGGSLRIRMLPSPPRLLVDNDGPPIPAALLDRIFDPFVTGREGGTGLGLSTAWALVEAMGGSLRADNTTEGVCFTVTLRPPSR